MPKMKTYKAASKRYKVTGRGKLLARPGGQDHFNSRESSKVTRNKRRDRQAAPADVAAVRATLPNHRVAR
jgi:large subunit ribosomal protein L35